MPKVEAIRVFDVPSSSSDKTYRVQFDGSRWYCDCPSWVFNHEHKGEKDEQGRAMPRECKHTRTAAGMMERGTGFRIIRPLGPWYEELQDYVSRLVTYAGNGEMTTDGFASFRADLERFREEADHVRESLETADTMLDLYKSLLRQISKSV